MRILINCSFMDIITGLLPLIPVLVTFFGLLKNKYFFFFLGYSLYSLLVIPFELNSYASTGEFFHLIVAALWLSQLIITFPNKLYYDGSKVFKSFAIKVFLSLVAINIIGVFAVLNDFLFNDICVYYHALLAFFPIVGIYFISTNKISVYKNE